MNRTIWDWLEIEPTKDKAKIKAAYAAAAKNCHPAEFPEEFQELRRSYNQAMKLADRKAPQKQVSTPEPAPAPAEQPASGHYFNFDTDDDEDEEEEIYDFIQPSEEPVGTFEFREEEPEPEETYDFGSAGQEVSFSNRQKDMLGYLSGMMERIALKPWLYGSGDVMKIVFSGWDKDPYRNELTPDFVASALDSIDKVMGLDYTAYDVLEKLFFKDRIGNEWDTLHTRFMASRTYKKDRIKEKRVRFNKKDINQLFYDYSDTGAFILYLGWIMPEGLGVLNNKKAFICSKNVVVSIKHGYKYYFCSDLTCEISSYFRTMRIKDQSGKTIIKIRPEHPYYLAILDQMKLYGARMVTKEEIDNRSLITKIQPAPDGKAGLITNGLIVGRFVYHIRTLVKCVVGFWTVFMLLLFLLDMADIYHNELVVVFAILVIMSAFFLWFTGFYQVTAAISLIYYPITLLKLCKASGKLKDDIRNGKASYLGGSIILFDEYLLYIKHSSIDLIPFRLITRMRMVPPEGKSQSRLEIITADGKVRSVFIGVKRSLESCYSLISTRCDSLKSKSGDDVIMDKYSHLLGARVGFFRGKFLVDQKAKNVFDIDVMVTIITFSSMFSIASNYNEGRYTPGSVEAILAFIVFFVLLTAGLICAIGVYSFYKVPLGKLTMAMIQTKYPDAFINPQLKLYMTQDYFMAVRYGNLILYSYDEIEKISMDGKIYLKDGKFNVFMNKEVIPQVKAAIASEIRSRRSDIAIEE